MSNLNATNEIGEDFLNLIGNKQPSTTTEPNNQEIGSDFLNVIESKEVGKEKKISKGKIAADIILPTAGAIAGTFLLGPAFGAPLGAAAGKAVEEIGQDIFTKEDKKYIPRNIKELAFEDTVLGNVIKEGVLTVASAKAFNVAGKALKGIGPIVKGSKIASSEGITKIGQALEKVKNSLPIPSQEEFVRNLSLKLENYGLRPDVTKFILDEGPSKVLTKENLYSRKMKQSTITKVSNIIDNSLDKLSKEFEKEITPSLKKAGTIVPDKIVNIKDSFLESIQDVVKVNEKGKFIAKASIDDNVARDFNKLVKDLDEIILDPTAQKLHKFKQTVNATLGKKSIIDNKEGSKKLFELNRLVRDALEEVVPGYKKINNKYRVIYGIEENIGKKLDADKVETLLTQLFDTSKVNLQSSIRELGEKIPEAKTIFNEAMKERAAKDFVNLLKKGGTEIPVPFTFGTARVSLGKKTGLGLAKELVKKEAKGRLQPISFQLGKGAAAGALGGLGSFGLDQLSNNEGLGIEQ